MLRGVFARVSAAIETLRTLGLEGPLGLTLEQTEARRQDEIAWVFEQALERGSSTNQFDVLRAIQDTLKGAGDGVHMFGEITENDVVKHWDQLPEYRKAELGLIELSQAHIDGDKLHREQVAKAASLPAPTLV